MYFVAIASCKVSKKVVKENLDNKTELQEFSDRMEKRGLLSLEVQGFNCDGLQKVVNYEFNGQNWEKK